MGAVALRIVWQLLFHAKTQKPDYEKSGFAVKYIYATKQYFTWRLYRNLRISSIKLPLETVVIIKLKFIQFRMVEFGPGVLIHVVARIPVF